MRSLTLTLTLTLLLCACSSSPNIEDQCGAVAESYCCEFSGAERDTCAGTVVNAACKIASDGCRDGAILCMRSSVDFGACRAAIESVTVGECIDACAAGESMNTCEPLPAECLSEECDTAEDGCAEFSRAASAPARPQP